jgi:two-component system response regulator MprA
MPNILVVEDDALVYETISVGFSLRSGFTVDHAADGYRALAVLETSRPDLALIDVGLPKASGVDVASRAVALGVPAVLMTAYGDVTEKLSRFRFPVLTKPFRVAELVARFDDVVSEAARLNRLLRAEVATAQALRAEAQAIHGSRSDVNGALSEQWARLCEQILR